MKEKSVVLAIFEKRTRTAATLVVLAMLVLPALIVFPLWEGSQNPLRAYLATPANLLLVVATTLVARKRIGLAAASFVGGVLGAFAAGLIEGPLSGIGRGLVLGAAAGPTLVLLYLPPILACITARERPAYDGVDAVAFVTGAWLGLAGILFALAGLGWPALAGSAISFAIAAVGVIRSSTRGRWLARIRAGTEPNVSMVASAEASALAIGVDELPWTSPPTEDAAPFDVVVEHGAEGYRGTDTRAIVRIAKSETARTGIAGLSVYLRRAPVRSRELWILVATSLLATAISSLVLVHR